MSSFFSASFSSTVDGDVLIFLYEQRHVSLRIRQSGIQVEGSPSELLRLWRNLDFNPLLLWMGVRDDCLFACVSTVVVVTA